MIIREARDRGYALQLVAGDGIGSDNFALIAGPASDGALITNSPVLDPKAHPEVAELQREYFSQPPVPIYGALQAWAQAVEKAGTFETNAVAETLRTGTFDTVLGTIGFDAKGDITGSDAFVWYVWTTVRPCRWSRARQPNELEW